MFELCTILHLKKLIYIWPECVLCGVIMELSIAKLTIPPHHQLSLYLSSFCSFASLKHSKKLGFEHTARLLLLSAISSRFPILKTSSTKSFFEQLHSFFWTHSSAFLLSAISSRYHILKASSTKSFFEQLSCFWTFYSLNLVRSECESALCDNGFQIDSVFALFSEHTTNIRRRVSAFPRLVSE